MSWVKWYRSKTAWVIIIAAVVVLVGAFCCAYYLPYPLNLITAIAWCVPSDIINNEAATSAITIKLARYAYDKWATDADVVAALANHPNISLAK